MREAVRSGAVLAAACRLADVAEVAADHPHATDAAAAVGLPRRRRAEFLGARALLRALLEEVPAGGPLSARPGGQPYLAGEPELGISLSHSGGWVAAAVNQSGSVGIDVQLPFTATDTLIRRCCTPAARVALTALPPALRDLELAWIWSVQEACVKAAGAGLAGRPWLIPVGFQPRNGRWHDLAWRAFRHHWPVPVSIAQSPAIDARRISWVRRERRTRQQQPCSGR